MDAWADMIRSGRVYALKETDLGVKKSAIAQQLFGKSGRELIPLLNEDKTSLSEQIQKYGEASGMTNQLAAESDRFNDTLTELDGKFQSVKNTFIADILPTVNNIIKAFLDGETSTDKFSFSTKVFIPILKGLAIAGYTVVDTFRGIGREIGARAAQLTAFANLDFSGAKFIGQSLAEDNKKSRDEYDKFVETVVHADKVVQQYTQTQKKQQDTEDQNPPKIYKTIKALKEKKELMGIMRVANKPWPWRHWRELFGLGTLTVALPFLLYAWAALHLPAGDSSLLNTMAVPFGVIAAAWMKEDTLSTRKWLGCLCGFAGVALIVQLGPVEPTPALLMAAAACVAASACYGISTTWMKRATTRMSPLSIAAGIHAAALVLLCRALRGACPRPVSHRGHWLRWP